MPQQYDLLGGLSNEMIVNIVDDRFRKSAEHHQKFFTKVRSWYNLYRGIYTGERPPYKNVVMLPLLFSACWSDVANKVAISLGSDRIIEMVGETPESGPSAKRAESIINQQFLDSKILERMIDFLMGADVYGTGILQYGWRNLTMPSIRRENILGIEFPVRENVTLFDGPDIENVDILDFFPQPYIKEIDSMLYVCRRYWKDLDDLVEQDFLARESGAEPMFDPQAIAELYKSPPALPVIDAMRERNQVWRSFSQFQAMRNDKYAKPVELIDMIALVPAEYAPDGVRFRIMTIANRMRALRNVASPFGIMRKHFRTYSPMPDMHYFHGVGKVEIGATMAASANKLVSNRLDVLDLVLQPSMFVSDSTELDVQNLALWPGRIIKVHGETGEAAIRPLQFDLTAYPLVVNELEAISRYIDMGTGVQRDTIQGLMGGDRQTAREFLGRMEQARTRLGLEAKLFERAVIENLAGDYLQLNRKWLKLPRMISLVGSAAQFDPDTGAPIPQEPQQLTLTDLNMNHTIRGVGASQMLSKSMQRQDLITALQIMQSNPIALQTTNWVAFFNKFWRAFEFDPREMIVQRTPPANAQAAQGALSPDEQAGPIGDLLGRLAPNIFGGGQPEMNLPLMPGMGAGLQQNMGA